MARTIGDFEAKKVGLIAEPEVSAIELSPT